MIAGSDRLSYTVRHCCVTACERKCFMGRMNWSRIATRDRMRRHGVEDVKGKMPFVAEPPKPQPRRKLSKGELRQQTAAVPSPPNRPGRREAAGHFLSTLLQSSHSLPSRGCWEDALQKVS